MAATLHRFNTARQQSHSDKENTKTLDPGPFWSELDQYRLLGRLNARYVTHNQQAGRTIIGERTVIQPQEKRVVATYCCQHPGFEFEMAITLGMCGVTVRFSKRRRGRRGAWLKHDVFGHGSGQSHEWTLEHSLEFPTPTVGDDDVKMWFLYLYSGFLDSAQPNMPKIQLLKAS